MDAFINLFILGIVTSSIGILGFVVYINNRTSITHKVFLLESLITIIYIVANYSAYQISSVPLVLIFLRTVLLVSLWHAFFVFYLFYAFPREDFLNPKWFKRILFPLLAIVSILVMSPLSFKSINGNFLEGNNPEPVYGPAMAFFGILVICFVISSIVILSKKMLAVNSEEKRPYQWIFLGTFITYLALVVFNYVFPVFLHDNSFIPYAPIFIFPFIIFTAYGIIHHRLLKVKVLYSEVLVFLLAIATLSQVFFSASTVEIIFRVGIFVLVLLFGLQLIQSAQREAEQREKTEKIANDLSIANDNLRVLDRQKSEFVSIASHQLRTPLTAIKGYSSMILEGSYGKLPIKAKEAVDKIFQSSQRLTLIIEDFLNVSRIEQGRMAYEFSSVDIKEMVSSLVEEFTPRAKVKGQNIEFKWDQGEEYHATADSGKLRQVLSNLIDNAVKYTEGEGTVQVKLSKDLIKSVVLITIKDSGIGMTQKTIDSLFQKFSRADGVRKIYTEGTGLGLYVAAEMMKAHHGKIWAESAGEGKGSTFCVMLLAEE